MINKMFGSPLLYHLDYDGSWLSWLPDKGNSNIPKAWTLSTSSFENVDVIREPRGVRNNNSSHEFINHYITMLPLHNLITPRQNIRAVALELATALLLELGKGTNDSVCVVSACPSVS
jgi:hypothetical protein